MANALELGPALVQNDATATPQATPTQPQSTDLAGQWNTWLNQPGNRNGVIQFGINMLGGMRSGDSLAGKIGRAAGGGMAARDRSIKGNTAADLAQRESDRQDATAAGNAAEVPSKIRLNDAQAAYYGFGGARANSNTGALTEGQNLQGFFDWLKTRFGDPEISFDKFAPEQKAQLIGEYQDFQKALGIAGRAGAGGTAAPPSLAAAISQPGAASPAPSVAPTGDVLPPQAVSHLSEGKTTIFQNGQGWTLRAGQPVRVK